MPNKNDGFTVAMIRGKPVYARMTARMARRLGAQPATQDGHYPYPSYIVVVDEHSFIWVWPQRVSQKTLV